jgi:hypothetical protein
MLAHGSEGCGHCSVPGGTLVGRIGHRLGLASGLGGADGSGIFSRSGRSLASSSASTPNRDPRWISQRAR